jgi:hypothetical protein
VCVYTYEGTTKNAALHGRTYDTYDTFDMFLILLISGRKVGHATVRGAEMLRDEEEDVYGT